MKMFETLYKKTQTDAIQFWSVAVEKHKNEWNVVTRFGQKDTLSPQVTWDVIKVGKNIGKKNETSAEGQAYLEAEAMWTKKKKKGYVEKLEDAKEGKLDAVIKGGIEPMLAHAFDKQGHKIKYPCFVQPKLDGHRCIAIISAGICELWTRTRKKITSVPHINSELATAFPNSNKILDGELYSHKHDFEYISHIVRQEEPDANHKDVEYHIYDIVNDEVFSERAKLLNKLDMEFLESDYINIVHTKEITTETESKDYLKDCLSQGFEGIMLRNSAGKYVNKRSSDLIKMKTFCDEEFEIIGIKEGRGKLRGSVGAFKVKQNDGTTFEAKMSGDSSKLKEYFEDESLWRDKKLNVKFQGRSTYGIPRFPVGVYIREDI